MDDRQPTLFEEPPIQEAPETGKTTSEPGIPEAFKITNETVLEPATPEIAKSTVERILEHITNRLPNPLSVVKPALIENPTDPELLILAALAALLEERHRLALRHLLSAAGSSPAAAAAAIHRFIASNDVDGPWLDLHDRYSALPAGSKEIALIDLLRRNPDEKKIVFVHHRETLSRLDGLMRAEGMSFARFDGSMSGPDKDRAVERFRSKVPLLLCTESGGEGRNLQFCNTLINFDLPWNPMDIEQRIGRLHRIGQERQVFIFNLVVRNTLEEYVLRILDEKINMFELVVGEIDAILGEMTDEQEFAEMVFSAWVGTTEYERSSAFGELGEKMADAKRQYEAVKVLDENLFGDEFVAA